MNISRRQFLKNAFLSLGLLQARWPVFLRQSWTGARAAIAASPVVAIVTGADYDDDLAAMTRAAVALATDGAGMGALVSPGQRVFIKPNFTGMSSPHTGDTTKPAIVAAVAEMCLEAGARRVTIGEAASNPFIDVASFGDQYFGYLRDYITDLNDRFGTEDEPRPVRAVDTKHGAYHVFVPAQANMQTIALSHHAADADVVISLPVLKTHMECLVVLGIKNLFGLAPPPVYDGPRHKLHQGFPDGQQIHQVLADIAAGLRPALTVMDASIGLEGNGPHHYTAGAYQVDVRDRLSHWLMLASRDPVALDATSTRVIGLDPQQSEHLMLAHGLGLGEIAEAKIQIAGTPLDEVRMSWLPPSKGIMMEAESASTPPPSLENPPTVQPGPIVYADQSVSCSEDESWQFGDDSWAQASVAYIGEQYVPNPYQDPEGRTAAVAFHVERPGIYIIFGRALADTPGSYPADRLCASLRDADGHRQQELIFQRVAPLATWYFDSGWYWQSYGMYELDVGDYALSFKSAYLRRRLAVHCFFLAPLLPLPDGRLCVLPPFRPLEARGSGWEPQNQLLTSTTPGAEAQVSFDVPLLAEYDVHLVAHIPPGYRLGVRLEQGDTAHDTWLTGEADRWQILSLGQMAWTRGEAAIGFQNDPANGTQAMQVDALLFLPGQHRVWLPLVAKGG
jgi:uncharacterized protein (DUF362 family)